MSMSQKAKRVYDELVSLISDKLKPLNDEEFIEVAEEVAAHCEAKAEAAREDQLRKGHEP